MIKSLIYVVSYVVGAATQDKDKAGAKRVRKDKSLSFLPLFLFEIILDLENCIPKVMVSASQDVVCCCPNSLSCEGLLCRIFIPTSY